MNRPYEMSDICEDMRRGGFQTRPYGFPQRG